VKAKNQRLVLALLALAALIGAALLGMSALRDQASYFYSPSDAQRDHVEPGRAVRLGGMVERGSMKNAADGVTVLFIVTDGKAREPQRTGSRSKTAADLRRQLARGPIEPHVETRVRQEHRQPRFAAL